MLANVLDDITYTCFNHRHLPQMSQDFKINLQQCDTFYSGVNGFQKEQFLKRNNFSIRCNYMIHFTLVFMAFKRNTFLVFMAFKRNTFFNFSVL